MSVLKHSLEVIYTLATMDLKLRYQNSKLGFLWSFIKPLLQFCTYYIVFGVILHYSDSADYPLRMFLGILLWVFFTEGTSMGLTSYIGKKSIITKVRTKKELLPIAAYFTAAISFVLNLLVFLIMYHIFAPNFKIMYAFKNILIFIICFLFLSAFILSINIILANVNALFRDIQTIWEIILMYGCFLTPIMYTLPIPEKYMALYLFINPLVVPIESIRTIFFETDVYLWKNSLYMLSYVLSIVFWIFIAYFINKKFKDKVADYL